MNSLTPGGLFSSFLGAVIYGLCFSVFYSVIRLLTTFTRVLPKVFCRIIDFNKLFDKIVINDLYENYPLGRVELFLFIQFFFIGFIVFVSYFFTDGIFRIYHLIISIVFFFLSKKNVYKLIL